MVSKELDEAAFYFTDGKDLSFSESVVSGIEKEVVIDYLEDYFPDKSFTDEEIKEATDLIIEYAMDHVEFLTKNAAEDFEKELDDLLVRYEDDEGLRPLTICKILIDKANYLFPNV